MGVNLLLDTHAVIWVMSAHRSVPTALMEALADPRTSVFVSVVSAFEIATKVRLGKLESARALDEAWEQSLGRLRVSTLDLTTKHALRAGRKSWVHRDPFDRLLAAQAIVEGLTLVSADKAFDSVPGLSLLRWT